MNTALNYVLIFGKLGFLAMGAAVVSLGLLSTAKYQRKAQRSGSQLKTKSKPSAAGLLSTAKCQRKAQRSGFALERRSKGAQTKNPAVQNELPDFERSGLCSDAGTPARARTGDLGLRRLALYPTELQTHRFSAPGLPGAELFYLFRRGAVKGSFRRRIFRKRALYLPPACDMLRIHG